MVDLCFFENQDSTFLTFNGVFEAFFKKIKIIIFLSVKKRK